MCDIQNKVCSIHVSFTALGKIISVHFDLLKNESLDMYFNKLHSLTHNEIYEQY